MTDMRTSYAIIKAAGSQHQVHEGEEINFFHLSGKTVGDRVEFSDVLLVRQAEGVAIGSPIIAGARVEGSVLDHHKGKKIRVATYKAKSRYRRVKGHRDQLTRVKIERIILAQEKSNQ